MDPLGKWLAALTTVDIDGEYVGRLAANSLVEAGEENHPSGKQYQLETSLVVGESTAAPPAQARKSKSIRLESLGSRTG